MPTATVSCCVPSKRLSRDTHVYLLTRSCRWGRPNLSDLNPSAAATSLQTKQCDLSLEEEIFCYDKFWHWRSSSCALRLRG